MIRLRDTRGKTATMLDSFRFVELCDLDGNIAALFYTDEAGTLKEVRATDVSGVAKYCSMYPDAKFCPVFTASSPH